MLSKQKIRFIQTQLNELGHAAGEVDGQYGKETLDALDRLGVVPESWGKTRKAVGFIQWLAAEQDIESGELDGVWGPQTEFAHDALVEKLVHGREPRVWRPEELVLENPNAWPAQTPEAEMIGFYGEPGKNQAKIQLPYPVRLAWKKSQVIRRFSCHEKVHDSLRRVLTRVHSHHGEEEIARLRLDLWGGCLNVRRIRGGTRLSVHSWGIALDFDPERNELRWGRDRASFAGPEYDVWWRLWEEEGWVSLGRTRNFDWMHVQAAI